MFIYEGFNLGKIKQKFIFPNILLSITIIVEIG